MKLFLALAFVFGYNLSLATPPPPPEGKIIGQAKVTVRVKLLETLDFRDTAAVSTICEGEGSIPVYEADSGAAYGREIKCSSSITIADKKYNLSVSGSAISGNGSKSA